MAKRAVCRQTPEVGAECPNWARSDLSGGRSEMGVPTGNENRLAFRYLQLSQKYSATPLPQ